MTKKVPCLNAPNRSKVYMQKLIHKKRTKNTSGNVFIITSFLKKQKTNLSLRFRHFYMEVRSKHCQHLFYITTVREYSCNIIIIVSYSLIYPISKKGITLLANLGIISVITSIYYKRIFHMQVASYELQFKSAS